VRKRLAREGFEKNVDAFFEHLAVSVLVEHRRAKGLDFTGVVTAPGAEDDPPAGQEAICVLYTVRQVFLDAVGLIGLRPRWPSYAASSTVRAFAGDAMRQTGQAFLVIRFG
jgi:hypothetical protein